MASPQTKNGYTKIANELMEALCRIRINGEARQALDFIFRKTYGFNKTQDAISLSQFTAATGLKRPTVVKALAKLKLLNLITQKDNSIANIYRINKDFETWKPLPKKITEPKKITGVTQKDNNHNPKRYIQKTVTKETITKDISGRSPLDQVNLLINIFQSINPGINYANQTNRKAAEWLINKYGFEKASTTSEYAIVSTGKPYAPVITTPYQLKENLGKLIAYYKREAAENKTTKHLKL